MRKEDILLILLFAAAAYLTAYTASAHLVATYITEMDGKAYWNSPGGSLWPWPKKRGGIGIPVLIELDETDSFVYNYLIKTYLLSLICALLWLSAIILIYRRTKHAESTSSLWQT